MSRIKVAVVHSLMTPYRLPLFLKLTQDEELDVRIFVTEGPSQRQMFKDDGTIDERRIVRLPEIVIPPLRRGDEKSRFNLGIGKIFSWRPDVVLVYGFNEPTNMIVLFTSILRRIPFVLIAEVGPQEAPSIWRRLSGPLIGIIVKRAAALGAASSSCERYFKSLGARQERITKIPCMPDVACIMEKASKAGPAQDLRKKLGLEDRFVATYLGRFLESKGLVEMFTAVDKVSKKFPEITLVVAGFGPKDQYVKSECERRGKNCLYYGVVNGQDELAALFGASDVHLMPSWYEGFGVVAAEALSCGVPTIVTSTSGCVDIVTEGVNGLVVPPRNAEAIADALTKLLGDPALLQRMKAASRESVSSLTMDVIYGRLKKLILNQARPR